MAKKLALTLIVAGAIGTIMGAWTLKNSCEISKGIRNEQQNRQLIDQKYNLEIRDSRLKINEAYGGIAMASIVASLVAVGSGSYLLIGKKYFDST